MCFSMRTSGWMHLLFYTAARQPAKNHETSLFVQIEMQTERHCSDVLVHMEKSPGAIGGQGYLPQDPMSQRWARMQEAQRIDELLCSKEASIFDALSMFMRWLVVLHDEGIPTLYNCS